MFKIDKTNNVVYDVPKYNERVVLFNLPKDTFDQNIDSIYIPNWVIN